MPFDPNLPQTNTEIDAVQMRSQLTGLKDLIDAVPIIASAVVDDVTTVPDGDPASVGVSVVGNTLHLTFGLQRGDTGADGPVGPPFAQAVVDSVNTLPAGSSAQVSVTFDGVNVHFTFDIPQGAAGEPGTPGEVSQATLDTAIATTALNPDAVQTLGQNASATYDDTQMQAVLNKVDELINALVRVT